MVCGDLQQWMGQWCVTTYSSGWDSGVRRLTAVDGIVVCDDLQQWMGQWRAATYSSGWDSGV